MRAVSINTLSCRSSSRRHEPSAFGRNVAMPHEPTGTGHENSVTIAQLPPILPAPGAPAAARPTEIAEIDREHAAWRNAPAWLPARDPTMLCREGS